MTKLQEFNQLFNTDKPIIGMVHLLPLPGAPLYDGKGLEPIIARAIKDAQYLQEGGVEAIEIENFSDPSYFPGQVGPELVASMAIVADRIRQTVDIPMGICILADPMASLAVAHGVEATFIRATFFTEASVDVSGLVLGRPHEILRFRKFLDPTIKIFADVHIKHSAPLVNRPIEESALDAVYFLADAMIVSGTRTGAETPLEDVKKVKMAVGEFPVLVGSGTKTPNVESLLEDADGAIVGTSMKVDGVSANPVDPERVIAFMKAVKELRA